MKHLQEINNWDIGAALKVKANLVHTEATFDLGKLLHTNYNLQIGADFRDYIIVPDGNYFINPTDSGHNLNYTSYGFYVHASKRFLHDRLQLSAVLRGTGYEYYDLKWNPRLTAVYELTRNDFVRFSYQNGYRFPSIFEGFSNINSGGVKRVGGLKVMSNGVFENSWLKRRTKVCYSVTPIPICNPSKCIPLKWGIEAFWERQLSNPQKNKCERWTGRWVQYPAMDG